MKNKLYQNIIRDEILFNYIEDTDENMIDNTKTITNLDLLVDNMKACKISGVSDVFSIAGGIDLKFACKYICSLNKNIKKYIKENAESSIMSNLANTPKEYEEISSYLLHPGMYYAMEDSENSKKYIVLLIKNYSDDKWLFEWTLYFVGKKCIERRTKYSNKYKKFKDNLPFSGIDKIEYVDGRASTESIFKTFDQMVFTNKDNVIKYIDNWKKNIPEYNKYGMIPKLSVLLYGEPGTGKSTFCKALASYLDIHSIKSLSSSYFDDMVSKKKKGAASIYFDKSILCIDDIDTVCASREDDSSRDNNKAIGNLLDFLDNPPSFYYKADNGKSYLVSIVVATTNYIDKLDKAVKRYGRFDLKIEMNRFTKQQAQEMCDIYNLKLEDIYTGEITDTTTFSPAEIQALCLENIDNSFKRI